MDKQAQVDLLMALDNMIIGIKLSDFLNKVKIIYFLEQAKKTVKEK